MPNSRSPSNAAELERIYQERAGLLRGLFWNRLRLPRPELEDLVQECFVALAELLAREGYRGEAKIETLLFSIAQNKIADHLRKAYREDVDLHLLASEEIFESPEISYENRERFSRLLDAIGELPQRERAVFELCGLGGLSGREGAARLGISERAAAVALRRAKRRLSEILGSAKESPLLSEAEILDWLERFVFAYIRFAQKRGRLTPELEAAAFAARTEIKERISRRGGEDGTKEDRL
jgi:RNA polymerase sigma-70 factor (ECF subfamily)